MAESLTGWTSEQAVGRAARDRVSHRRTSTPGSPSESRATRGAARGHRRRPRQPHRADRERTAPNGRSTTAPRRSATTDGHVSGCVLIFRDVSERREFETARCRPPARGAAARLDRRVVRRRDHEQVARRHHPELERRRRAALRLSGRRRRRPPHLARHSARSAGRRGPHHRQAEGAASGSSISRPTACAATAGASRCRSPSRRFKDDAGNVVAASKIVRDVTDGNARPRPSGRSSSRWSRTAPTSSASATSTACRSSSIRAGLEVVGLDGIDEARGANVRDFFFPEDQARIMDEFFPAVLAERPRRDRRPLPPLQDRRRRAGWPTRS